MHECNSGEKLTSFKSLLAVFLQMTAEAILRLVNDPVLPFYPLDIALDVQNKLKGNTNYDLMIVTVVCDYVQGYKLCLIR